MKMNMSMRGIISMWMSISTRMKMDMNPELESELE
jgi:hypothetical protein